MRKLASIQRILSLDPIEGADKIEKAKILGWQVVVKKGDFNVGDLVVYCEIDSLLPEKPEFEFLRKNKFRIRTIRLKSQISQGICFPLSILPKQLTIEEDLDVTELMEIVKYDPPIPACLSGIMKGKFPSFIPKTDETRVQILQKVLDKYKGQDFYVTAKLDGSSATYYIKDGVFGVCSRNMELLEDSENSFWKVARQEKIEEKLRSIGSNIAIQGELVGEGIQGNKLAIRGHEVYFFNLFDIDRCTYSNYSLLKIFCETYDLKIVPLVHLKYELSNNIEDIIKLATIKCPINPKAWAEGIVLRPYQEQIDLLLSMENFNSGRVSFKAINPEFLLAYGE